MERILSAQQGTRVRVFAVWEPMLVTDLGRPTARALARLADGRVRQYWDQQHVMARRLLQDARDPQPKPNCCEMDGNLWDLAAVYPPGARWEDRLPPARVFDGPIVKVQAAIVRGIGPAGD